MKANIYGFDVRINMIQISPIGCVFLVYFIRQNR